MSTTPRPSRLRGWLLCRRDPKLIRHEEKLVVIFRHPPKDQQTEEFDCWTIHCFAHVTEEGEESGLFTTPIIGGGNNGALLGVSQPNPNIEPTTTHTTQTTTQATDGAQGNDNPDNLQPSGIASGWYGRCWRLGIPI